MHGEPGQPNEDHFPPTSRTRTGPDETSQFRRRCLAVVSSLATVLAAPALGFYLLSTCPPLDSFDGKRELKRVLRG